ncbi:MAG: hypothetical protein GF331_20100 [Chitinivibrionales bacterium]|nr:hypothetical protein [Chitinivibrionales bacterium]
MRIRIGMWALLPIGAAAVWLLTNAAKKGPAQPAVEPGPVGSVVDMTQTHAPYRYTADFRDPFRCDAFMGAQKPKKTATEAKRRRAKAPPRAVTPPQCEVGGIVYNETNPMAILVTGGSSRLVKAGDTVDSVTVERVDRDTVWVRYRKKRFGLPKG